MSDTFVEEYLVAEYFDAREALYCAIYSIGFPVMEPADLIERLDLLPSSPSDPDLDAKASTMRRIADEVDEVQSYAERVAWGENERLFAQEFPRFAPRSDILCRPAFDLRRGLCEYGLLFGLDMLEDAVNSGVPLEDIVA